MNKKQFREEAHKMADRIADYYDNIEGFPVKAQVSPGDIFNALPDLPPDKAESIDEIMADFDNIIMPGITHWQHPSFFAYFPANTSYPSILAEMLTAALAQQGMVWETSPASTELEEKVVNWLKAMCGLPGHFTGVIQDTASTCTLAALITARERLSGFVVNSDGFKNVPVYRLYCTAETHSSIEKATRIAGFGSNNLVKIPTDDSFAMLPDKLIAAIEGDLSKGYAPCCVIATIGTTGCTAVDPVREIGKICRKYNIWLHVDGAFAGTSLVLPEMRKYADGLELADSYVFNPHKWMFTNFDCSLYYVADADALIKTFEILPEYLKTRSRGLVNDYRDWGIALGRRFRALKLWFVIRNFGTDKIKEKIRLHISLAQWLTDEINKSDDFELLTQTRFSLVCFRYKPSGINDESVINSLNEELERALNKSGKLYITHTTLNGKYTLRLVVAQTYVEERHVQAAWNLIQQFAAELKR